MIQQLLTYSNTLFVPEIPCMPNLFVAIKKMDNVRNKIKLKLNKEKN